MKEVERDKVRSCTLEKEKYGVLEEFLHGTEERSLESTQNGLYIWLASMRSDDTHPKTPG